MIGRILSSTSQLARGGKASSFTSMRRLSNVLVVAEISGKDISPGTLSAVTAAKQIGGGVSSSIAPTNIISIGNVVFHYKIYMLLQIYV